MASTQARTLRFYQGPYLALQLNAERCLAIVRHQHQPLALRVGRQGVVLACDAQDSVLHTTASGYTPYGYQPTAAQSAPLAFTGEIREPELKGYLLGNGHRAFSPTLRRFYSPDSLSPLGKGGINAYAYCAADPVNNTDPDGRMVKPRGPQPQIFSIARRLSQTASHAPTAGSAARTLQAPQAPPPSYPSALASLPKSDPGLPPPPEYSMVPGKGQYTLRINMAGIDASSPITSSEYQRISASLSEQNSTILDARGKGPKDGNLEEFGALISAVTKVEQNIAYGRIALQHRLHVTQIRKDIANFKTA